MIEANYGIKIRRITKRNPQTNAIVERAHQTIGNIIRNFSIATNDDIDDDDLWSGILGAVAFGLRATVHTTSKATPMQLVFGRDAILNIQHAANWKFIKDRKQSIFNYNNRKENKKRIPYEYRVKVLVMVKGEHDSVTNVPIVRPATAWQSLHADQKYITHWGLVVINPN